MDRTEVYTNELRGKTQQPQSFSTNTSKPKNIVRPKNIVKPRIIINTTPNKTNIAPEQIGECEFCGRKQNKASLSSVKSIQKIFKICPDCKRKFQLHRCLMCGTSTVSKMTDQVLEWKGLCQICAQIIMAGAEKLKLEQEMGVDFDSTMEVIPNRNQEMTQQEINDWLDYGRKFMESLGHNK